MMAPLRTGLPAFLVFRARFVTTTGLCRRGLLLSYSPSSFST
jgi:hypothetical protein